MMVLWKLCCLLACVFHRCFHSLPCFVRCPQEARERLMSTTKDATLEFLLSYLPSMPIPPLEGEDGGLVYTISHMSFEHLRINKDDVEVLFTPAYTSSSSSEAGVYAGGHLTVTGKNMGADFKSMMWSYKQTSFPYMEGGGVCDATVGGVALTLVFAYHPRRSTPAGMVGPWFTLEVSCRSIRTHLC
jgi:hypothetical protein